MTKTILTQEVLKELIHYDPETGVFTWAGRTTSASRVKIGGIAGTIGDGGYRRIKISGKSYYAQRIAVMLMTGSFPFDQVDHINGDKLDNRWINLRCVTINENKKNRKKYTNNKSGVVGVCWHKIIGKWHVQMGIDGKHTSFGYFTDIEDAAKLRKELEVKYEFHENHGRE